MFQSTPEERALFPEMRTNKGGVTFSSNKHPTGKICKHCKVDVVVIDGKAYPILGKQHKPSCPRARNLN